MLKTCSDFGSLSGPDSSPRVDRDRFLFVTSFMHREQVLRSGVSDTLALIAGSAALLWLKSDSLSAQ